MLTSERALELWTGREIASMTPIGDAHLTSLDKRARREPEPTLLQEIRLQPEGKTKKRRGRLSPAEISPQKTGEDLRRSQAHMYMEVVYGP